MTQARSSSTALSVAIHAASLSILLWTTAGTMRNIPERISTAVIPLLDPAILRSSASQRQIGGGGGMHENTPAAAGRLPRIAPRQFVPPMIQIMNPHPKLAMEMTIEAPPEVAMLNRNLPNLGDPLSHVAGFSAGMGGPLGIGNGNGTGVGDQRGPAAGAGNHLTGTIYRPGQGVTLPVVLYQMEPEFTEEARKARFSGTVLIAADIDSTGHPRNIRVVKTAGMGLDDRAAEAVAKWVFKPGTKDGKPVAVSSLILVSFRLL